jgi:hypothetical protein
MGETTKWSNIAFGRIPLKLPTTSLPNVNLTTYNNYANNQRYRTELSLNIADYSYISRRKVGFLSVLIIRLQFFFIRSFLR